MSAMVQRSSNNLPYWLSPLIVLVLLARLQPIESSSSGLGGLLNDHQRESSSSLNSSNLFEKQVEFDRDQLESISNDVENHLKIMLSQDYVAADDGDANTPIVDDPDNQDLDAGGKWRLFSRVKSAIKQAVAPAAHYINLIRRYQKWFAAWNELVDKATAAGGPNNRTLKSALDTMRIEYAKVDEQFYKQACDDIIVAEEQQLEASKTGLQLLLKKGPKKSPAEVNKDEIENVDFVLNILGSLIDRLEEKLDQTKLILTSGDLDKLGADEVIEPLAVAAPGNQDEAIDIAVNRAKRIVSTAAKNVAFHESKKLLRFLALNALATYVKNRESTGEDDPLRYLEPIILLFGSADTSFLVTYLRDLQFRAALGLANQFMPTTCKRTLRTLKIY